MTEEKKQRKYADEQFAKMFACMEEGKRLSSSLLKKNKKIKISPVDAKPYDPNDPSSPDMVVGLGRMFIALLKGCRSDGFRNRRFRSKGKRFKGRLKSDSYIQSVKRAKRSPSLI